MEAVFSAVRHMRLDVVQKALDDGDVGPDTVDYNGNTLLIVAAQNNNRKVLKLLLRREASLDAQNTKGNTALHYALAYRFDALAE